MPVLNKTREIKIEWTDINTRCHHPVTEHHRSAGVHVSGVIKYVLTKTGYLKPDDVTDEMPLRMAVGMAWEDWAVGLWPDMQWQPGQVSLDGIHGSPDGVTGDTLEEFKATWKSAFTRSDILKEKIWMWQLMAYCKMMRLTKARLHVLWVNGDYRPPSPRYATYEISFTRQEINDFWNNVMLENMEFANPESGTK